MFESSFESGVQDGRIGQPVRDPDCIDRILGAVEDRTNRALLAATADGERSASELA